MGSTAYTAQVVRAASRNSEIVVAVAYTNTGGVLQIVDAYDQDTVSCVGAAPLRYTRTVEAQEPGSVREVVLLVNLETMEAADWSYAGLSVLLAFQEDIDCKERLVAWCDSETRARNGFPKVYTDTVYADDLALPIFQYWVNIDEATVRSAFDRPAAGPTVLRCDTFEV